MNKYYFSKKFNNVTLGSLIDLYSSLNTLISRVGLNGTFKHKDALNLPHSLQTLRSYDFIQVESTEYKTVLIYDGEVIKLTKEEYKALPSSVQEILYWNDYFSEQTRKINTYKFDVDMVIGFMDWVKPIVETYENNVRICHQ